MWHDLNSVAHHNFLNAEKFVKYAKDNAERFQLDNNRVSSWWVDKLIKEYKEFIGNDEYIADREECAKAIMAKYTKVES